MIRILSILSFLCMLSLSASSMDDQSSEVSDSIITISSTETEEDSSDVQQIELEMLPEDCQKKFISYLSVVDTWRLFSVDKFWYEWTKKQPYQDCLTNALCLKELAEPTEISRLPHRNLATIYSIGSIIQQMQSTTLDTENPSGSYFNRLKSKFIRNRGAFFRSLADHVVRFPPITNYTKMNIAREKMGHFFLFQEKPFECSCARVFRAIGRNPCLTIAGSAVLLTTFWLSRHYLFFNNPPQDGYPNHFMEFVSSHLGNHGEYFHDRCQDGGQARWIIYDIRFDDKYIDSGWHPQNYRNYEDYNANSTDLLNYLIKMCPFNASQFPKSFVDYLHNFLNATSLPDDFRILSPSIDNKSICYIQSHLHIFNTPSPRDQMQFDFINFSSSCALDQYAKEHQDPITRYYNPSSKSPGYILYCLFVGTFSFVCFFCISCCSFLCK